MAFGAQIWGIGAPGSGTVTVFTKQPNTDVEILLVGRRGMRGGGEFVNGLDGVRLRWGGGGRGTISHTDYKQILDLWTTHAKANAGMADVQWFNEETDAWEIDTALVRRPRASWMGTDGTGPRRMNVELEIRSIGLP